VDLSFVPRSAHRLMTSPRRPARAAPAYSITAPQYDQIYRWKEYAKESRQVARWIRRYGRPGSRSLLDVGCGSGEHLRWLGRTFDATGLDINPGMLREARRKLPRVRFVRARMEDFHLGRRFDAITCLFSAIGYVRSARDLRRTFRSFAEHLEPGGVAIVEPWLSRRVYRVGKVTARIFGDPESPIVRMNVAERRGDRSVMDMHHLIATPRGIRHVVERHDLGMFDRRTYFRAIRAAGLRPRYFKDGLMPERGLYLAIRPRGSRPRAHPVASRTTPRSRSSPKGRGS
jgi:SAM-dependent methyltransferase